MRLFIEENYEQLCDAVAAYLVDRIMEAKAAGATYSMALPASRTVLGVYERLVAAHRAGRVDFAHVLTFSLDEYASLPRDSPHSQHTFMWTHFFRHVNVQREHVHFLDGNAPDWDAECARFEAAIAEVGGLDVAVFSTGPEGHVARNEPGSSLRARTRAKTLAYDTRLQLAERWGLPRASAGGGAPAAGGGALPEVALTMGVATIGAARELVVLFSGISRAAALERAIERGVNHMCPVSAYQRHPCALFWVDEDATLELKVKTVTYFKGLQQTVRELGAATGAPQEPRPESPGPQAKKPRTEGAPPPPAMNRRASL